MRYTRRSFVFSAASLLWPRSSARAQDAPVTFSSDVKVVNVLSTVLNKKGQIIGDLTRDDFTLLENGRPQAIKYFATQSDLPLTLGLMVDTSMSQARVLNEERAASFHFLDRVLRENKDQVFIMQFDMSVQLQQDLTSSRKKLDDALSLVDTPTREALKAQYTGGTLLYDALVKAAAVMKPRTGRKALIVLTDGVDNGSNFGVPAAIEAAQRADTLIYSILFSDETFYGVHIPLMSGPDGSGVLMRLSKETGGGYFAVSKKQSVEQIFDIIQDELRSQYSLGYVSDTPVVISEFRKIQLTAKQKGLIVQARDRYWAQR